MKEKIFESCAAGDHLCVAKEKIGDLILICSCLCHKVKYLK